jgi:hypothetical protein
MFTQSQKIGKVEVEEQKQEHEEQDAELSSSPLPGGDRVAATTPTPSDTAIESSDSLILLRETVRPRLVGSSLPVLSALNTAHSTTSAASLPISASDIDDADQLILKLHMSRASSTAARAKGLREMSSNFFPKALEV